MASASSSNSSKITTLSSSSTLEDPVSPFVWKCEKNPLLTVIQVDPYLEIDERALSAVLPGLQSSLQKGEDCKVLITDATPLLYLTPLGQNKRNTIAEYLRQLVCIGETGKSLASWTGEKLAEKNNSPNSILKTLSMAYEIPCPANIQILLNHEECQQLVNSNMQLPLLWQELKKEIDMEKAPFLDSICQQLFEEQARQFYAKDCSMEGMVAQSILNYKLTPAHRHGQEIYHNLCAKLSNRLSEYIDTKVPVVILLEAPLFNIFLKGSCADLLITSHGAFENHLSTKLAISIEELESQCFNSSHAIQTMLILLSKIWVIFSLLNVIFQKEDGVTHWIYFHSTWPYPKILKFL
jgi:hypothetical protein